MACGGESGRDACRAGEHAPVGTTLCPEPAQRPPVWIFTSLSWERNQKRTPQLRRSGASSCRYGQRAAALRAGLVAVGGVRSEEHTSELQTIMRQQYARLFLE